MANLQIQLSDDLEVERLAKEAGYADAGAYVEALVRADRRRRAEERLAEEVRKGLESPMMPMDEAARDRLHADYAKRRASRNGG